MASHFFLARLRNFPGEAGHQTNASAARFRGELIRGVQDRWTLSRAGLSLSKSLSVRRVISRNPFCAVLSRSSLPKKGRRENEKPTKTMQLFNRARFLPLSLSLFLELHSVIVSLFSVFSRRSVPCFSWHCLGAGGQGFALSIGTEIQ